MNNFVSVFNALINQCQTTMVLFDYVESNKIPLDASDLLRWQYVLATSALDKYIHDIVRSGMVDEFHGKKSLTPKYKSFRITLSTLVDITTSEYPGFELEQEIIRQHSYQAFQDPDKIADALSFIWDEPHKWKVISQNMNTPISEDDLKIKLRNIVIRRNQIVHQGDCDFAPIPVQQIILKEDVNNVVEFIKELVYAIEKCIQ